MVVFTNSTLGKEDIAQVQCALRRLVETKRYPQFQRYTLLERLDCEGPEACFHVVVPSVEVPFFLRIFPREALTLATTHWLHTYAKHCQEAPWGSPLEFFHELGIVGDRGFIVSEYIQGASLADLSRRDATVEPFSWPMALTLFCAGLVAVFALHEGGLVHGRIRPQSIRVTIEGEVILCCGLVHRTDERSPTGRERDLVSLGRAVLPLGAGARADQVRELFSAQGRQAFTVLSDLIIEEHPEFTDLVVAVLWPIGGTGDELSHELAKVLMRKVAKRIAIEEEHRLLRAVAECGPDFQGRHRDLAIPGYLFKSDPLSENPSG